MSTAKGSPQSPQPYISDDQLLQDMHRQHDLSKVTMKGWIAT